MTYLELVNEVLRRLREDEVSAVTNTSYSTMVGDFVNDAKNFVERAWAWTQNRSIITVTAVDGTPTYSLTGFGQQGQVLSAWNDTHNVALVQVGQTWIDRAKYIQSAAEGAPYRYCFRGEDVNDDAVIEVYPTPDTTYSLKFNCYIPTDELSSGSDVLSIPWRPVVLRAVAMLAEEKGETGSTTSARWFEMADKALDDAIAYDAGKHPDEFVWYGV